MRGLSLVRHVKRIEAPQIVTERLSGVSDGRLYRLRLIARTRIQREGIESTDEVVQGDGTMIRYPTDELEDGFYRADSTCDERTVFFQIAGGGVERTFRDERQTLREMKRA